MDLPADNPLLKGLELTRKMLELVQAGEWESVAELGKERLSLLRQWTVDDDGSHTQTYLGLLQEIQRIDREIEALSRRRKAEAADQLRQIHQRRKADKAYRR
jgi:Arc/MetJ-type ribon-helix-helix transcriptional regulator